MRLTYKHKSKQIVFRFYLSFFYLHSFRQNIRTYFFVYLRKKDYYLHFVYFENLIDLHLSTSNPFEMIHKKHIKTFKEILRKRIFVIR